MCGGYRRRFAKFGEQIMIRLNEFWRRDMIEERTAVPFLPTRH